MTTKGIAEKVQLEWLKESYGGAWLNLSDSSAANKGPQQ